MWIAQLQRQVTSVALRKESVDRNISLVEDVEAWRVALRKESVDRNGGILGYFGQ